MKMSRVIFDRMIVLFSNDPLGIYGGGGNQVSIKWITAPFTPRADLTLADLTIGNPGIYVPEFVLGSDPTRYGFDAYTGETFIWTYMVLGTVFRLLCIPFTSEFTVYGFALLGQTGTVLWATKKFDRPMLMVKDFQTQLLLPELFRFPVNMVK